MKGMIFDIQRFCLSDGPGIRTTVFLKGCPLRCAWCHNPEAQKVQSQMLEDTLCGKKLTVQRVMEQVEKDRIFYDNSGGGLTLSGGEPLWQFDFTRQLLYAAKKQGIHTCVETCGYGDKSQLLAVAVFTDLFLYDWKLTDSALHKACTGAGNEKILENLQALDAMGAKIILRCPIIPGINDTDDHFAGIAALANTLQNLQGIELEPYHSLGIHKYKKLGRPMPDFPQPEDAQVRSWLEAIGSQTHLPVNKA